MKVRFWGCRGSIPRSRPDMVRYGGNTLCVQVTSPGGTHLTLDMGSGAPDLGRELLASGGAKQGVVLITHTHWDHIQGFPFFSPLFIAGNQWKVYGPRGLGTSLRETLAGQMQYAYFPVSLEQMAAEVDYHDLVEGVFAIGDVRIEAQYMNHTALALGYRMECDGVVVVYATDHEPYEPRFGVEGYQPSGGEDDRHVAFIAGADLLIHDAQYTAEEYPAKKGWGHSPIEYVVDIALAGQVRRLALFHHDPMRDDETLDRLVDRARERVRAAGGTLEVFAAADGQALELAAAPGVCPVPVVAAAAARLAPALQSRNVLVALSDPATAGRLTQTLRDDKLEVLVGRDTPAVLATARTVHPALLLVEQQLPGGGAFEICRQLRNDAEWGREVPFIVVATRRSEIDERAGREVGVTDWLVEPFSNAYARTRIRAWVLRAACRWQPAPPPEAEQTRLAALRGSGLLDTPPEERFDRLTRIAAELFRVPIALVSLVDENRQWFKSHHGLDVAETPRDQAFCAHAIHRDEVMIVPNALQDDRFADNPLVTGEPHVRFYSGCPLALPDGSRIGVLCLMDHRARHLGEREIQLLRDLAALVERELAPAATKSAPCA